MRRYIRTLYSLALFLSLLLVYTPSTYAYLDPGTGSMLLAVIVGVLSTLLFVLRGLLLRIGTLLYKKADKKTNAQYNTIVCYSEGAGYWNVFKPLIDMLAKNKQFVTYLSSDETDLGLTYNSEFVHTLYIGTGNKAYTYLNFLRANICVLTTPNLDTLQIRKSKNVLHYTHLVHAPTDFHLYKLYAFDFYDSVMISGNAQKLSLRFLETLRNTTKKPVYPVGCTYLDVLKEKKIQYDAGNDSGNKIGNVAGNQIDNVAGNNSGKKTLLIAPTWGTSGLLYIAGKHIIQSVLNGNYNIIIRPHPQSLKVEKALIDDIKSHFSECAEVEWDTSPDNFSAMAKADILLSERSGILFDFAFIFENPVITYKTPSVLEAMEGYDIPWNAWELDVFADMGAIVEHDTLHNIDTIINKCLEQKATYQENIRTIRDTHLYNFGEAGIASANAMLEIQKSLSTTLAT